MRKVTFMTAILIVAILAIGLTIMGSNMGFKIAKPVTAGGDTNWTSLPYFNSFSNAQQMFNDLTAASLAPVQVSRWENASGGSFQNYTGARGSVNFLTTKSEAYLVKVGTAGNWIVVGSHDPSYAKPLTAGGDSNWTSVPYHTTDTNAQQLFNELTAAGRAPVQVSRWENASGGSFQNYTGARGSINFLLTAGEGYLIKVGSAGNWTPSHY